MFSNCRLYLEHMIFDFKRNKRSRAWLRGPAAGARRVQLVSTLLLSHEQPMPVLADLALFEKALDDLTGACMGDFEDPGDIGDAGSGLGTKKPDYLLATLSEGQPGGRNLLFLRSIHGGEYPPQLFCLLQAGLKLLEPRLNLGSGLHKQIVHKTELYKFSAMSCISLVLTSIGKLVSPSLTHLREEKK
jgi:hypothetical protein